MASSSQPPPTTQFNNIVPQPFHHHLLGLPPHLLFDRIILPMAKEFGELKTMYALRCSCKQLGDFTNDPKFLKDLNLADRTIFDKTSDQSIYAFAEKCVKHGNKHAALLFSISVCFCYGRRKRNIGLRYMKPLIDNWSSLKYAYAMLIFDNPSRLVEATEILLSLKARGIRFDALRPPILKMLKGKKISRNCLHQLDYKCTTNAMCGTTTTHHAENGDIRTAFLACSDVCELAAEYSFFRKCLYVYNA